MVLHHTVGCLKLRTCTGFQPDVKLLSDILLLQSHHMENRNETPRAVSGVVWTIG